MKKWAVVIVVGILFSMVNTFVSMYLGMKTGFADGIAVLLMFAAFIIFTAIGLKARSRALVCMSAIIMGSTGVAISYTDGLGAIIISGEAFTVPDYAMVAILTLSGIIGILLSSWFAGYFLRSEFPWPGAKVMAALVTMLTAEKGDMSRKVSVVRMGVSTALSGAFAGLRSFGAIPEVLGTTNVGLSLSPLMAGIGMLIGWRASLQIAAGAVASLFVFIFIEGAGVDYMAHMRSPWVFSTAISMMVATAVITMYVVLKPAAVSFLGRFRRSGLPAADGGTARNGAMAINPGNLALLAAIAGAAILMAVYPGVPAWIFVLCMAIAILFMVIETRGRAEAGMGVGMSSFVILLIVGLAFDDIVPLLVLEGFVVSMILTFSLMFIILKQSEFCGVETKGITTMALIGVVSGAVICVPFMKFFNGLFGIGTAALPAPYSVMWLEMANTAVAKIMSPSLNVYLVLLGIVLALVLYRFKISAVALALGLILPVATSAAILVGGIIAYVVEKKGYLKDDNGITASGLMAGDIIVSILASLRYL